MLDKYDICFQAKKIRGNLDLFIKQNGRDFFLVYMKPVLQEAGNPKIDIVQKKYLKNYYDARNQEGLYISNIDAPRFLPSVNYFNPQITFTGEISPQIMDLCWQTTRVKLEKSPTKPHKLVVTRHLSGYKNTLDILFKDFVKKTDMIDPGDHVIFYQGVINSEMFDPILLYNVEKKYFFHKGLSMLCPEDVLESL